MITRRGDWIARFNETIEAALGRPFVWGRFDCCLFACDVVEAMTGVDLAAGLRGTYSTAIGARRALREHAGGGLRETVEKIAAEHSIVETPALLAQRGDVAMIEREGLPMPALAITSGGRFLVPAPEGLASYKPRRADRAWRI